MKCKLCGQQNGTLRKDRICPECKFKFGRVWELDMSTWRWSKLKLPKLSELLG